MQVGQFSTVDNTGRWNLYAEVRQPPPPGVPAPAEVLTTPDAVAPERPWLETTPAEPTLASVRTRGRPRLPDVRIVTEGELTAEGIRWRTNPYDGRIIYRKKPEATRTLGARIAALDADVLAVQEVESIEALAEFIETTGLRRAGYRHLVLVEGNDVRLIDVAVISRLPIGAVTSWRHRTYQNRQRMRPIFSRDLLVAEILSPDRSRTLLTLYNTHLKSRLATDAGERRAGDLRRRRQAETIAAVIRERPPPGPYVVVGDMNDGPDSPRLEALRELGLVDALTAPEETGGPYPADPNPPTTTAWTHRYRAEGRTDYELFDQIWLSPDLARWRPGSGGKARRA